MIPDRMIEEGTLRLDGPQVSVQVRIPWYRALPGSCIAGAELTVDGVPVADDSLRWTMNGTEFTFEDLVDRTDEWWFPLDSATLSGVLPDEPGASEHEVEVALHLYIPYIITDHGVLRIDESAARTMKAVQA